MRQWAWGAAAAAALLLAVFLVAVPTGQYVILPGFTEDLSQVVRVQGARPPAHGRLMMVAVTVEPADWWRVLTARFNPAEELVPSQELVPPGDNFQQYVQLSMQQMDQSHEDAKAAAFAALGMPVRQVATGVWVWAVMARGPSARLLRPGDRIISVAGQAVMDPAALRRAVGAHPPGSRLRLVLARGAHRLAVQVRLGARPGDRRAGFLGVAVVGTSRYVFPRAVHIATSEIGGSSAGMMFSLEIVAQLRPGPRFPDHLVVAGTGTISPSGQVGPIAGVGEKLVTAYRAGARIFLCPKANYPSAARVRRALGLPVRIIAVTTLRQALRDLGYRVPRTA